MSRPLKLLFYTAVDGTHAGGVQSVVGAVARGLAARGHRVRAIWAEASGDAPGAGVVPLYYRGPGELRRPDARRVHLPSLARAAALLARTRPDVVHVNFLTRAAFYFLLLRRTFGHRVVLTAHGSDVRRPWPEDGPLLPALVAAADQVTAVSGDLSARLTAFGERADGPVRLIANGVDTDFWAPAPPDPGAPPTFLAVGRLEPVKGADVLIDAFARLAPRAPGARLCLVGEGSEAAALADQARRLGVADRVDFAGRLGPEQVRARLRDAIAYVLPSRSEGMPVALLEAMACGRACVAARVGGVPEVAEEAALLVPPEDPAALAEALHRILAEPALAGRLATAARTRALAFSAETALDAYEATYRAALAQPRA